MKPVGLNPLPTASHSDFACIIDVAQASKKDRCANMQEKRRKDVEKAQKRSPTTEQRKFAQAQAHQRKVQASRKASQARALNTWLQVRCMQMDVKALQTKLRVAEHAADTHLVLWLDKGLALSSSGFVLKSPHDGYPPHAYFDLCPKPDFKPIKERRLARNPILFGHEQVIDESIRKLDANPHLERCMCMMGIAPWSITKTAAWALVGTVGTLCLWGACVEVYLNEKCERLSRVAGLPAFGPQGVHARLQNDGTLLPRTMQA